MFLLLGSCLLVLMLPWTKNFLSDIVPYIKKEFDLRTGYPFKTMCRKYV